MNRIAFACCVAALITASIGRCQSSWGCYYGTNTWVESPPGGPAPASAHEWSIGPGNLPVQEDGTVLSVTPDIRLIRDDGLQGYFSWVGPITSPAYYTGSITGGGDAPQWNKVTFTYDATCNVLKGDKGWWLIRDPSRKPNWEQHLDWCSSNGDAGPHVYCEADYAATYPGCLLSGGRSCLMQKARSSARAGDCANAMRLASLCQCHNNVAQRAIGLAGIDEVCRYLGPPQSPVPAPVPAPSTPPANSHFHLPSPVNPNCQSCKQTCANTRAQCYTNACVSGGGNPDGPACRNLQNQQTFNSGIQQCDAAFSACYAGCKCN